MENLNAQPSKDCRQEPDPDEIYLLDLIIVPLRYKWLILIFLILTGIAAVAYSLSQPNVYRSEATLFPRTEEKSAVSALGSLGGIGSMVAGQLGFGGGGSIDKFELLLKSRRLNGKLITKYNLMPVLFPDGWDAAAKKWAIDPAPTIQDGIKQCKELLKLNVDTTKNVLVIGFELIDPVAAKSIVEKYIQELSDLLREEILIEAAENQKFFQEQLAKASDPLLKDKLYAMLANEIEKETFARAQKFYGFSVLDPPIVPDADKKVRPKRALICIVSEMAAFFFIVFLVFLIEFFKRSKKETPELYDELVRELSFRKRRLK